MFGQTNEHYGCNTGYDIQEQLKDPATKANYELFEQQMEAINNGAVQINAAGVRIIPVVFHVFHNGGSENISDAQLQSEIDALNRNFRRMSFNFGVTRDRFKHLAADMEVEFRLARIDPKGNCTNGIVRIFTPETETGQNNLKLTSVWPTDKYFNVWVVKYIVNTTALVGIAGYAQFPWSGDYATDGVMILNEYTGSMGTSTPNRSGTLSHEAGHWLNLFHTFQDTCDPGDRVDDTPPCQNRTGILSCDSMRNTCLNDDTVRYDSIVGSYTYSFTYDTTFNPLPPYDTTYTKKDSTVIDSLMVWMPVDTLFSPDMGENYMDYVDGACQTLFTYGQKKRVDNTFAVWKSIMVSLDNLKATGTDVVNTTANCPPIAEFYAKETDVCVGASIRYFDNSYNYSGTITTQWDFEGGSPATSTNASQVVTYATSGKYKVRLIVTNANGIDTLERDQYVNVLPNPANQKIPFTEGFEFPTFPINGWKSTKIGVSDWERYEVPGGSIEGNYAYRINNSSALNASKFNLISPSMDLTNVDAPKLNFYYAYSPSLVDGSSYSTDELTVLYSLDCGQNWIPKTLLKGTTNGMGGLSTVGTAPLGFAEFVPTSADKWKLVTLDLGNIPQASRTNVKIRFQFSALGGNNFYLDAINIGRTAGIQQNFRSDINFGVYPNPAQNEANVKLNLTNNSKLTLTLTDILGKSITTVADGQYNAGENVFPMNIANLQSGVYLINLTINGESVSKKLIINK